MSGKRSLPTWFAAIGFVVFGADAAALHFGDQSSVVDAPYEPRLPDEGSAYRADLFPFPGLPWRKQHLMFSPRHPMRPWFLLRRSAPATPAVESQFSTTPPTGHRPAS